MTLDLAAIVRKACGWKYCRFPTCGDNDFCLDKVRESKIIAAEALRQRGHWPACASKLSDIFPCDCGLDAALKELES